MLTNWRWIGLFLTFAISICVAGCDGGGASMDQMASATDAQKAAKQQQEAAAAAKAAADQKAAEAAANPQQGQPKKVGGRETQNLGGGYYAAIIGARRHVMNVADAISWIQGVRSFKAEEGRKPKDTAEFMKVVVPKYELQLPKIEDDEEYLYDPNGESDGDFGQLYVVKKGTVPEGAPAPGSAPAPGAPQPPAAQ